MKKPKKEYQVQKLNQKSLTPYKELSASIHSLDQKVNNLSDQIDLLDRKVDDNFKKLSDRIDSLDQKVDDNFKKLSDRIDSVHNELDQKIDALDRKIDSVHDELNQKIDSVHDKLNQKIEKVAIEVVHLKEEVKFIKETMLNKEDGQKIIEHIDEFARRVETYDGKTVVQDKRLLYLENHFIDHEKRIQKIETIFPK
ncbi:MAG: hypothetical protein HYT97_06280 [Elusimicrobia bacterium]|nr:hypothetical protein [Elusimicrobiota bacterium]